MNEGFLEEKLNQRTIEGTIRKLGTKANLVDFVSNDYLGLARNAELADRIKLRLDSQSCAHGGTGSRLLSGNHELYTEVESELSRLFNCQATLIFNSGYAANQALVSSVAGKGDTILYDQLSHVCLKEGAWLSKASTYSFGHNDLNDLESKLQRAEGRVFVITETIFSMDGDQAPISELVELSERFGAYLIVDEAHSTGAYGEHGSGLIASYGMEDRIFARVFTFGKAMGCHGACVAGSKLLVDYLINFGRPFIYTTSMPLHSLIAIQESFKFLAENMKLQSDLRDKTNRFKHSFKSSASSSAIQPIMVGSNEQAKAMAAKLQEAGLDVRPILSPTVRKGSERLRVSLHTHNSHEEIERLTSLIDSLL